MPRPHSTPWGVPTSADHVGDDIWLISTPGHGGLYIGRGSQSALPAAVGRSFLDGPNWAEEDCEMVIAVALLFDTIQDRLGIHWPGAVEESEDGHPRVVGWALKQCENYESYRLCREHILSAHGMDADSIERPAVQAGEERP